MEDNIFFLLYLVTTFLSLICVIEFNMEEKAAGYKYDFLCFGTDALLVFVPLLNFIPIAAKLYRRF